MASVAAQTLKEIELIVINDGSTEDLDDIIRPYMDGMNFPVMYVKKENGGVHTARNIGIKEARGNYLFFLDSDDEIVPDAIERLVEIWSTCILVRSDHSQYREVVCQCVDQNGNRCGLPFPEGINLLTKDEARKVCHNVKGEHTSLHLTSVLKKEPFPQPQGVTFVTENLLWERLDFNYRAYYINDMLRIYHTETAGSYTKFRKTNMQDVINQKFKFSYMLNHRDYFPSGWKKKVINILKYRVFDLLSLKEKKASTAEFKLKNGCDKFLSLIFTAPSYILSFYYRKRKME